MSHRWLLLSVLLLLFAFALRLPGLFANTFHPDEALFAYWSRFIVTGREPLLSGLAVDKPPLLFYLQAFFYPLLWEGEIAPRLPNLIASLLLIPLTGQLARRLGGGHTAVLLSGLLVALSPLGIQFSASAFTDPLMVCLGVTGLVVLAGRNGRWGLGGLWLGLALAAKYQALLFLPLAGWLLWHRAPQSRRLRPWLLAAAGLALPVLGVVAWELSRSADLTLLANQRQNFGALGLASGALLLTRLAGWLPLLAGLFGFGWFLLPLLPLFSSPLPRRGRSLWLFSGAYLLAHWLLTIPTWDRYLLPLLPLLAVGSGLWADELRWPRLTPSMRGLGWLALGCLGVMLLWQGGEAANGRFPVGSTPTSDQGAGVVAQHLREAPFGTVLFDHWHSTQWRYYFYDKGVYVAWVADPQALAEQLEAFGSQGRYIALPPGPPGDPYRAALQVAGLEPQPVAAAGEIVLYVLVEPAD